MYSDLALSNGNSFVGNVDADGNKEGLREHLYRGRATLVRTEITHGIGGLILTSVTISKQRLRLYGQNLCVCPTERRILKMREEGTQPQHMEGKGV